MQAMMVFTTFVQPLRTSDLICTVKCTYAREVQIRVLAEYWRLTVVCSMSCFFLPGAEMHWLNTWHQRVCAVNWESVLWVPTRALARVTSPFNHLNVLNLYIEVRY